MDNVEILERSFNEKDLVDSKFDLGGDKPEFDYSEQSYINKNTGLTEFTG